MGIAYSFVVKRILVLDKSPFIRYLLTRTLQSDMTTVATASNIEKAVTAVKEHPHDLFFLDMQMLNHPSMGETLRSLKGGSPQTKIMMMSETYPGDETFRELNEMMDVFIPKPFFPSEIRRLAGQAMGLGEHYWDRYETLEDTSISNKRRENRVSSSETIDFTVSTLRGGSEPIRLKGSVINRSSAGIGMLTNYPIVPGNLVMMNKGSEHHEGIVTWSRKLEDNTYSAGIFFV
jgi:CheY-like chemotaxis protein